MHQKKDSAENLIYFILFFLYYILLQTIVRNGMKLLISDFFEFLMKKVKLHINRLPF